MTGTPKILKNPDFSCFSWKKWKILVENPILNPDFHSKPGYPPGKSWKSTKIPLFREKWPFFDPPGFKVYCVQKWPFFGPKIDLFRSKMTENRHGMTPKNTIWGMVYYRQTKFSGPRSPVYKKGPPGKGPGPPPGQPKIGCFGPQKWPFLTPYRPPNSVKYGNLPTFIPGSIALRNL